MESGGTESGAAIIQRKGEPFWIRTHTVFIKRNKHGTADEPFVPFIPVILHTQRYICDHIGSFLHCITKPYLLSSSICRDRNGSRLSTGKANLKCQKIHLDAPLRARHLLPDQRGAQKVKKAQRKGYFQNMSAGIMINLVGSVSVFPSLPLCVCLASLWSFGIMKEIFKSLPEAENSGINIVISQPRWFFM